MLTRGRISKHIEAYLIGVAALVLAGMQLSCIQTAITLPFTGTVRMDPAGHAMFINFPRLGTSFTAILRETGPVDPITGDDPFEFRASNDLGIMNGILRRSGAFSSTGMGTVAGFPNVEKKLNLMINKTSGAISGTIEFGTNGALPQGLSALYDLAGTYNIPPGTPMMSLTQNLLGYYSPVGANPMPQTIDISNSGSGGLGWLAEVLTGQQFVSVSPAAGQAPGTATIGINAGTMPKGNYTGSVRFSPLPEGNPLNGPVTVPVEYSINMPYLNNNGTKSVADFVKNASPGSLAGTFGWMLATGTFNADQVPLNQTLGNTKLLVGPWPGPLYPFAPTTPNVRALSAGAAVDNLVPAPLIFVSPGQINFQIPWEYEGQTTVTLQANLGNDLSFMRTVPISAYAPGIFTLNQQGSGQGAILLANTDTLAAPVGSVAGRSTQPVRLSQFISIFCIGLGPVTNRPPTGNAASTNPLSRTTTAASVSIGGITATPDFSGLAPNFVGLYQINVAVPAGVTPGNAVPVTITIGGVTSNTATIAVQP